MINVTKSPIARREFLAGLGGLTIGFYLPAQKVFAKGKVGHVKAKGNSVTASENGDAIDLNSWLRITSDGQISIQMAKAEMGQNVYTTLPLLVAEELDADWDKIKVSFAPSQPEFAKFGPFTGGSSSVKGGYEALRSVGAAAREMLVTAASKRWNVGVDQCETKDGFVLKKGSVEKLSYGDLATEASHLAVPEKPRLKKPSEFKLIGKPVPRLDSPDKVKGSAVFGIDLKIPGMLIAAVRTSPVFGGEVKNFNQLKSKLNKNSGVQLVKIPHGVAAVSKNYWTSQKALNQLQIEFSSPENGGKSSAQISQDLLKALETDGPVTFSKGDVKSSSSSSNKTVSATYEVPYLAHATMEPMSCAAHVHAGGCEIWAGTQSPTFNKVAVSKAIGIAPEKVQVHTVFLGGGFGRRAEQDFISQAAIISQQVKKPVKVIWSREEDMQHDFYRPAFAAKLEANLSKDGTPVVWKAINAGSSIVERWFPDQLKDGAFDFTSIEGFKEINYAVANQTIRSVRTPTIAPVGFWRSVGSSQNAFFVESFIDELAHAAGQDPFAYRKKLLKDKPRHLAVLEAAAMKAGWNNKPEAGVGRGIAIAESFGTIVAEVIEASVNGAQVNVKRVVCAYDCGPIVNPDTIEAQMQSAIIFGLSAALRGQITLKDGRVEQNSFDDYPVLRMAETPKIEVIRVVSDAPMGGIGEPGTPPVAPALANAIFAASGKRIRKLPLEVALATQS